GVIIQCPKCQARYQYDPSRFEGRESKKIRCAKCQDVFEIRNPETASQEAASQEAPAEVPAAASHAPSQGADLNDMTLARHRRAYSYSGTPIDSPRVADLEAAAAAPESPVAEPLSLPPDRRFSLAITDGANAATIFRIEKPRMTIGRSEADIALDDAEASREHAALEIRGSNVILEDLGSTNGTFVNGKRIDEPVELQNQQEFVVGMTTLMLIVTPLE
ncbi:MAG TPA: FHA domain-containing protein, partial [Thermoanaerobaculia bacterium]|nr:FHA domain-containing protein [Thermoanaerobaculia bacterium]